MDHKAEQEIADQQALWCLMESMDDDNDIVRLLEIEIEALDQAIERVNEYAVTQMGARHERLLRRMRNKLIAKLHAEVNDWHQRELKEDARCAPIWNWLEEQGLLDQESENSGF